MPFQRTITQVGYTIAMSLLLVACGGGGGSSDPEPPTPTPPPTPATQLQTIDALPSASAVTADPNALALSIAHRGYSDFTLTYGGDCNVQKTVRRSLTNLGEDQPNELLDHRFRCPALSTNATQEFSIGAERDNGDLFTTDLSFSTGLANSRTLTVQDTVLSTVDTVNGAFTSYLATGVLPELNLPPAVQLLITANLDVLFDRWVTLAQPNALYNVTAQRVTYSSLDPAGNGTTQLTGLVAFPDTSGTFTKRDQIIVLAHSTSSTPGDLEATNAWFLTANLLAAQGYLVVAADNWGRGDTSAEPETYLLANRTATNSLDLVRAVIADDAYTSFTNDSGDSDNLIIIGYSQGGHSAIALWHNIATQGTENIQVEQVYAGGGPHNLFATFAGVIEHLDDSCNGGEYCRYVDAETTIPFATNRILPGFLNYTDTDLTEADAINADTLASTFVDNFINDDPSLDKLKMLLQLNSFTNILNTDLVYADSNAELLLYHSAYDRLVPEANTDELALLLSPSNSVEYRRALCSSEDYETIFNLTDFVGINHTLCGLAMIDEVVGQLR